MEVDPDSIEIEDGYIDYNFMDNNEEENYSESSNDDENKFFPNQFDGMNQNSQPKKQTSFILPPDDLANMKNDSPSFADYSWLLSTIQELCQKSNQEDMIPYITQELQTRNIIPPNFQSPLASLPPRVASPFNQYYEKVEDIGSGGYGKIIKVLNLIDEQYYSLKIVNISKDEISTAVREVQCLAALNSPRIVRYYSSWLESSNSESEATLYIQMEYVPGFTLCDYLFHKKDLTDEERKVLFYQITLALYEIHSKNIIHRDFSPNNIIVRAYGKITVIDFGIASIKGKKDYHFKNKATPALQPRVGSLNLRPIDKLVISQAGKGNKTVRDVGTPLYSSPRQLNGHRSSPADDVYSLGIVAFELYSGFKTWMEKTVSIRKLRSSGMIPPEFTAQHPEISQIVEMCTKTETKQRPTVSDILNLPFFRDMKDSE